MVSELAMNWWAMAIRGVITALFGVAAIAWPDITLAVLIGLFGIFMLADGVIAFITAVRAGQEERRWWTYVVEGFVEVGIGIAVFSVPQVTAVILLYFIAFWAIFVGIWRIATAIELRREIEGEWLWGLSGLVTLLFGFALLAFPAASALTLVTVIGIFALAFGIFSFVMSFRVRSWQQEIEEEEAHRWAA